jgi:AGCS family alanine or glycine:cation symporter
MLKNTLFAKGISDTGDKSKITRFQALSTALAAGMGTGNIVGVGAAILIGGAGSIFWMWVSALFGMASAYAENYLGVAYKNRFRQGSGAMLYLEHGLRSRSLAVIYAMSAVAVSLGMGNMAQSNAIAVSAVNLGLHGFVGGITAAVIVGIILFAGVSSIAKASERIIPFVSVIYILGAVIIIAMNFGKLPEVFTRIITEAFALRAAAGGGAGLLIKRAVQVGLTRGIFSNEAGMGSSVFVHTETECTDPDTMGSWAMLEVFIDTMICCSLTAFVILITGADKIPLITAGNVVTAAFGTGFGAAAGFFVALCTVLFAFATLIGWAYYGEKSVTYLVREKNKKRISFIYKCVYVICIVSGAIIGGSVVWELSDIFNALMLFPNIIGILVLSGEIKVQK